MNKDGYFIGGGSSEGVTQEELDTALQSKADSNHTHDGTYAPTNHTHAYGDLTGKPTIPTNNNQLSNGAGYITGAYDNSTSGLTATDIQSAIDELKALIDGLGGA